MATSSRKVIYAALIGNTLIAITKFGAAAITRSSAMLSEGIHSLVDTGNQVLLLHGLRRSEKPADEEFPFGHGKELYFWSFVVAILIFVLGLAMVFEGAAWFFAWRAFKKHKGHRGYLRAVREGKDPSMFVVLFEDSAAMLGLVAAFCGVLLTDLTGILFFDGLASIIIGFILGTGSRAAHT
jgi:divalent metal cation (Fe/Co/Zn/Cd) transporter